MTNPFYVASGTPATSSFGASQPMRSEFQAIQGGFEKFPDFTGSAPGTFLINNFTATGITTAPGMLIDPSGNIGIGTPPNPTTYLIDVRRDRALGSYLRLMNASTDPASGVGITLNNGTARNFHINYLSQNFVTSGINRADGASLIATGDGGLTLATGVATLTAGIYFATNSIERARFDNNGTFTVHGISNFDTTVFQKGVVDVVGPLTVGTATLGAIFLRSNGGAGGITATIIASGAATYLESILGPLVFLVGGGTVGSPGSATQRMIINNSSGDVTFNGGMLTFTNGVGGSEVGRIGPNWVSNAYGGLSFYYLTNSSFVEGMRLDYTGNVGIGTVNPLFSLHIERNQNTDTRCFVRNSDTGNGASAMYQMGNDTTSGILMLCGSTYSGGGFFRPNGVALYANGFGGLTLATRAAVPIFFHTQDVERMRIDAAGTVTVQNPSDMSTSIVVKGSATAVRLGTDASAGYIEGVNPALSVYKPLHIGGENLQFFAGLSGGNTERMRLNAGGSLNCPRGFNSASGTTPLTPSSVPYAFFNTVPGGLFLVWCYMNFGTSNYSAFAIVSADNTDARIHFVNNGTLLTISLSGYVLYVTQGLGANNITNWVVTALNP